MSVDWATATIARRLRDAADVIEEMNRRKGFNVGAPWSPRALRLEAEGADQ